MEWLPKFIALRSSSRPEGSQYAYYESKDHECRGSIYCGENDVFNPFTKIEVERAKTSKVLVHLRFCHSNKYWALRGPDDRFIYADSDKPEEDRSKLSCTLFMPRSCYGLGIELMHIQSGKYLDCSKVSKKSLRAQIYIVDTLYVPDCPFHYLDWDTLIKMPKHVAFKGDNGKYLRAYNRNMLPYLQFSSEDGNHEFSVHEVIPVSDGNVCIRTQQIGKLWRCTSALGIYCDSNDYSGDDLDTLFCPIKVDDRTVALKSASRNYFCSRVATKDKMDLLHSTARTIRSEAKLVVEQLVLERNIFNVRYRMEDARVFDEKPFLAGFGTADNHSDKDSTLAIKFTYEDNRTESFTKGVSLMAGFKTTAIAQVPFIFEGKIELSAQLSFSVQWGETTQKKKLAEAQYTACVPAKTRVRVKYIGMEGKCNVPFSYTQRDKNSFDGNFISSEHIDGIFTGVNYYNFDFVQDPTEPL